MFKQRPDLRSFRRSLLPLLWFLFLLSCQPSDSESPILKMPDSNGQLPYLVLSPDKTQLYLSWVEKVDDSSTLYYASWQNDQWSSPNPITSGKDWFVNWADYPMIAVNDNIIQAHFLQKSSPATFTYDVSITQSLDGTDWSNPMIIHNDSTHTEHGFVSHIPRPDGSFQVVWLDGRNTSSSSEGHDHHGSMTLRTAKIDMQGNISDRLKLDDRTCDCCQTSGVWTKNGSIVVYRDRSDLEIRDIYITRQTENGWTIPKPVWNDNWHIEGCPVNGPRLATSGDDLSVAWFTAANNRPTVKVIFSDNLGESFKTPMVLDDDQPLGRVDVAWIDDNTTAVSWLDKSGQIIMAVVDKGKGVTSKQTIAQSSIQRSAGFPQLEFFDRTVFVTWTSTDSLGNYSLQGKQISL